MERHGLTESGAGKWTRPDDYLEALARKRTARKAASPHAGRTEPEAPQLMMSTVPFLALIAFLGVLTIGIVIAAFPGSQPLPRPPQVAAKQVGVAAKGWLQEAEKDFHK
ncbi:MAG TPA: hypothetical protein VIL42_07450 [Sphingomicrobium sp.]|jgi:hypothetical protein